MNIGQGQQLRGSERRRKRMILPLVYFLAEGIFAWLILVLIQFNFNIFEWDAWAIVLFIVWGIYSVIKTIHVYQRQREYPSKKE